jgi:hypothetical protein
MPVTLHGEVVYVPTVGYALQDDNDGDKLSTLLERHAGKRIRMRIVITEDICQKTSSAQT